MSHVAINMWDSNFITKYIYIYILLGRLIEFSNFKHLETFG